MADLPGRSPPPRSAGQAAQFNTAGVVQTQLGPHDGVANPTRRATGFLLSAFDPARLNGSAAPLPASYAMTNVNSILTLPHLGGNGCTVLGITPIDVQLGVQAAPPADFFARPSQTTN